MTTEHVIPRRAFLAAVSTLRVFGANERVRCGLVGAGGRGQYLAKQFVAHGAEVGAVCDVYEPNLAAGLKAASPGARGYDDYRRMLEDKSIDAVVIATPEHRHAGILIDSVEAGKDVYVEKPLAHKVEEGFRMVEAVRRTKRIAQIGTQRRSYGVYHEAKRILDSGVTGPIRFVHVSWMNRWPGFERKPLAGKLDWNQWLGPAPKRPLDPRRFFNWLQFWDYSGGYLIGQAAHIVDGVQMLMNSTFPASVTATAAKPAVEGAEAPDTASMCVEFPENYMLVFSISYQAMRYRMCNDQMQQFHGTAARLDLGRESYALYRESSAIEMKPERERRAPDTFDRASEAHVAQFIDCVRTRKEPNATIEMGNATNVVLCMAIESMRTGRKVRWNAAGRRMES